GLAAVVIAQDEAMRFQEQRARQAELLLALAEAAPDEPAAFARQLAATISQGLPVETVELLLHDPERGELVRPGADADRGRIPVPSEHAAARALESGRPVVADGRDGRRERGGRRQEAGAVAAVPLRLGVETGGVLLVTSADAGAFQADNLAF